MDNNFRDVDMLESEYIISLYEDQIRKNPYDIDSYLFIAMIYFSEKMYSNAKLWCLKAKNISSKNPDIYYILGGVYKETNKTEYALKSYKKALDLYPLEAKLSVKLEIYQNIGDIYFEMNELTNAIYYYTLAKEMDFDISNELNDIYNTDLERKIISIYKNRCVKISTPSSSKCEKP